MGLQLLGKMGEAQGLFDEMLERDVFIWAVMIDEYGKVSELAVP